MAATCDLYVVGGEEHKESIQPLILNKDLCQSTLFFLRFMLTSQWENERTVLDKGVPLFSSLISGMREATPLSLDYL